MITETSFEAKGFVKQPDGSWIKKPKQPMYGIPFDSLLSDSVDDESELHREIIQFLTEKRWPFVHSRMDKRTTQEHGTPDFVCALPEGKVLWLECKAGKRKLDVDQQLYKNRLENNNHTHYTIHSKKEFKAIIYNLVNAKYL